VLAGGAGAGRISRETVQKIRTSAERLGYRPNLLARSLRTRRTHTIGFLISDISNPFFGQIGSLIEHSLHRRGYSLMLCNSGEDPDREAEYLQVLSQKAIDGLILVPLIRTRKTLDQYLPPNLPMVMLDRPIPGVPSVSTDQNQSSAILCDTLERAGVKRVALVNGPLNVFTHRRRVDALAERFEIIATHEGPPQRETGRQAFIKFLALQPDAIVCTNNFLAAGMIECFAEVDRPPIIGVYDEVASMHLLPIPMVVSLQDVPLLAEGCVSLLMKQLEEGPDAKIEPIELQARALTNRAFQIMYEARQGAAPIPPLAAHSAPRD
jgi:DNA-binding LacI/PurR family transcriptional regulator